MMSSTGRGRKPAAKAGGVGTGAQQTPRTNGSSIMVAPGVSTPTSSKVSLKSSLLPYQYRRELKIGLELVPLKRKETFMLGIGSAVGNLKTTHIVNSKMDSFVNVTMRIYKRKGGCRNDDLLKIKEVDLKQIGKGCKMTPGGNSGASITTRMKTLTIYESPKSSKEFCEIKERGDENSCSLNPCNSVVGKCFLTLNKKANYVTALNRKVNFSIGNGKMITVNPTKKLDEEAAKAIALLCRNFRNILGWKLSMYYNWAYVEAKINKWYLPNPPTPLSLQEIAELLQITTENIQNFQFCPDMEIIFNALRSNLSHVAFPNFARLLALQKIQLGQLEEAALFVSAQMGMYPQSEIIDKHLAFIGRVKETKKDETGTRDVQKAEIFRERVQQTVNFSNSCFSENGKKRFKELTSFNEDWNIVQISTGLNCSNRFGYELIGVREVPQLILTAMGYIPMGAHSMGERSEFTTFCNQPVLEPGSQMRHGLLSAFDSVLVKNMMISDSQVTVSRKKYWEERARHDEAIESVMYAMEEWLFPWTFLLPGSIKDSDIKRRILKEVIEHKTLLQSSDSQKFVIYRLTECYHTLPMRTLRVLESLVAFILGLSEDSVLSVTERISEIGSSISLTEPRNPTILVLDQDIDLLPWDWLPCLRSTNVSRMPSLNLIHSTMASIKHVAADNIPRIIDSRNCTFILNPDTNLPAVQDRLEKYFCDRESWLPIVGRPPTSQEMEHCLENQHLLLYCGHGSGSNFYPEYKIQKLVCKAIPILMGCSSAQSRFAGPGLYSYSNVHAYMTAGCTSVVGFLWEITDVDCDRLTAELVQRWLPNPHASLPKIPQFDSVSKREHEEDLCQALRLARTSATQLLTRCAAVVCGLPVVKSF